MKNLFFSSILSKILSIFFYSFIFHARNCIRSICIQDSVSNYSGTDAPLIYPTGLCGGEVVVIVVGEDISIYILLFINIYCTSEWPLPRTSLLVWLIDRLSYILCIPFRFGYQVDRIQNVIERGQTAASTQKVATVLYHLMCFHELYETSNSNGNNGPARSYLDVIILCIFVL